MSEATFSDSFAVYNRKSLAILGIHWTKAAARRQRRAVNKRHGYMDRIRLELDGQAEVEVCNVNGVEENALYAVAEYSAFLDTINTFVAVECQGNCKPTMVRRSVLYAAAFSNSDTYCPV